MSDDYRLLITGSREATADMLRMAYSAVERAKANDWQIIVGDADGIDKQVIYACCWLNVPFQFCGITLYPRNTCCTSHLNNYTQVRGNYLARDRYMAHRCHRVFAIWNGISRGTKYTYDYVRNLGKPGDIRRFAAVQAPLFTEGS